MKIIKAICSAFLLTTLVANSGCVTKALWKDTAEWNTSRIPAEPNHVRVFEDLRKKDFVVVFDQISERSDRVRVQAYYLYQNQERISSRKRPHFVSVRRTNDLKSIPLFSTKQEIPPDSEAKTYVVSPPDSRFLVAHTDESVRYELPVYEDGTATAMRVALTLFAATADVAICGLVVGTFAAAHGAFNDVH
jgi:hypothetical protein